MQAFVCFSACLFTLQQNNVVREIVQTNNLSSNATCTDFCTDPVSVVCTCACMRVCACVCVHVCVRTSLAS